MRILVADNNRLLLEALTEALTHDGHEVLAALDGLDALDRLHSARPDCCVLDILMPRLNGDRVCAYMKADPDLKGIPVILVTGLAGEAARGGAAGLADAVLAKGPLPTLMANLRALLDLAARGELAAPEGRAVVGAQGLHPREIVTELVSVKRHYETLLEHLGEGVIQADAQGRVLSVNRRAAEILGMGEHELLARWVGRCLEGSPRERLQEAFGAVVDPAGPPFAEIGIEWRGRALHLQLHRVPAEQGDFVVALTFRDVTPLVQGERLRAVAEMAAGVAHDFNNLLTAIVGRAELLRAQGPAHEITQGLDVITKAGRDGAALVRRLLAVARRRQADSLVPCDLNQVIEDAIEFTRPRWQAEAHRRGVRVEVVKHLERGCEVLGDPAELREVLTNLILNALDAMPAGGRLTIRSERQVEDVAVAVCDTGMGMPPEVRENLFRPYFTTKGHGGTGLGMSMAFAIIEHHCGRIAVESQPGQGTEVRLSLPAHRGAAPRPETPAGIGAGRREAPRSILLVDDDDLVREVLAEALRRAGHSVAEAQDGLEALALLDRSRFDLLVTDLGMPGIPGSELARRVKASGKVPAIALITGWGVDGDDRTLQSVGVDLVINKPFEVADAVSQLVGLPRG